MEKSNKLTTVSANFFLEEDIQGQPYRLIVPIGLPEETIQSHPRHPPTTEVGMVLYHEFLERGLILQRNMENLVDQLFKIKGKNTYRYEN